MKIYNYNGTSRNRIGDKVRELRKAEGLSQKDLAARLQTEGYDFTDVTILRIEKGQRFVPDYEVVLIAKCFHVSTDYLLGVSDR
ncbi:MAG: helix-turn-helix domain-containing protein [Lachnospiraceae bacterium]|nr:helix-turn-helix domain-containing protein [Lachnospiraceae bacterium]